MLLRPRRSRPSRGSTRHSTRSPTARQALAVEADDLAGELRRYARGSTPRRAASTRSRSGSASSTV
jgi:hypothetical protein